jgi:hypothetical protein
MCLSTPLIYLCVIHVGHGVCLYENNNTYDGSWVDDARCGGGSLTFSNGDVFSGHFLNNVMHGHGTFKAKGRKAVEAYWLHGDRAEEEESEEEESEEEGSEEEEAFDFGEDEVVF